MASGDLFAFGPYQLDIKARRLTRDGEQVVLASRQFDLLQLLVAHAGQVLSKDLLIEAAWPDVAVTDNSLEQAISSLRRMLTPPSGQQYIETQARRGYRFAADVTRVDRRETDENLDALLAPHRAWIEGRAALETLTGDRIVHARGVFEDVLKQVPDQAPAHVGLANACALQFEMTRTDVTPDTAALMTALHHAREACRLDPQYGEAWATLGFVLDRTGGHADALAASRRAVALEADNWRHHLRLAYASWGEERLREARRALALLPGLPFAHWLAASVLVARQALPEAERELITGIAAQDESAGSIRFSGVALHWLLGLIALANGDERRALDEFERELADEAGGHLYARECAANTWYSIGALKLRQGAREQAVEAFGQAIERLPRHPMARIGLAFLGASPADSSAPHVQAPSAEPISVEAAFARAAQLMLREGAMAGSVQAAAHLDRALAVLSPASAGWLLPLEPLLNIRAAPDVWAPVLSRVRNRAA